MPSKELTIDKVKISIDRGYYGKYKLPYQGKIVEFDIIGKAFLRSANLLQTAYILQISYSKYSIKVHSIDIFQPPYQGELDEITQTVEKLSHLLNNGSLKMNQKNNKKKK